MHTRKMVVSVITLCALFVSVWILPEVAASEGARGPAKPLAEMTLSASRIDWQPAAGSEHLALTVAGPEGLWLRRDFEAGQPASLSLSGPEWEHLPDGSYTWELRVVSPPGKLPQKPVVESGHFFVKDGSFVAARKKASVVPSRPPRLLTAEDFVEDGNMVVIGNACVGASCTTSDDNYSALRLKASQPNILFDDDFVEGGSSPHDWALFINPSSAAEFSIADVENQRVPFTIAGGAPNSSLYVASTGNVGLGTATPGNKLHVKVSNQGGGILLDGGTANSVNVWAQGNGAGVILSNLVGGTNQKVAQHLVYANTWRIRGLNDAVTAESVDGIVLSLINGNVGINCESAPGANFVVDDGGACNAGTRSELNAGATQFTVPSSRSLKEHLAPVKVEGILDRIHQVKVYSYDFINGPKDRIGLIAEDFHSIFGRGSDKTISGDEIQLALWLAIQELSAQNKELRHELAELRMNPISLVEDRVPFKKWLAAAPAASLLSPAEKDAEITELRQRLAALEGLVSKLAATQQQ